MNESIKALLPADFMDSLALVPRDKAVTLLTRHSIREQAENYDAHYKLPLTKEGKHLASFWGSLQPFESFLLYSSPVGRCIETAKHMFVGKHQDASENEIDILSHLAEPGCFIKNMEIMQKVGKVFIDDGPIAFLESMLSGNFEHYVSITEGVALLLQAFQNTHNENISYLNIHVSHDTILAAFVYSLLERNNLSEQDWPRMMEGVYLWFENDSVYGVWRGEIFSRKLSDYLL